LLPAFAAVFLLIPGTLKAGSFEFRDGDRIVVVGDSITRQGDYVRYLENYLRTRYPQWKLAVRNAGVNGFTAQLGLPILDQDVLVWNPTVVIVNYGMNDGRRGDGVSYYQTGIKAYLDQLQVKGVRIVLCSNSPLDNGDAPGQFTDYNRNFDEMARFAEALARDRGMPFVDQFHFCHTLWGENRRRKEPVPVSDQTLAPHPSDSVHARAPGQANMAYIILKTLGAPEEVSHVGIDAAGQVETRNCTVTDVAIAPGKRAVSFTRADSASPCWLDDRGALGLALVPFNRELNRMGLQVAGLEPGHYELKIDQIVHGQFTHEELARGINLADNRQSPVYAPGRKVGALVTDQKQAVDAARQVMQFQPPDWLAIPGLEEDKKREFARLKQAIDQRDEALAAAAQPKAQTYELKRIETQVQP